MDVSIVVPTHNGARLVGPTIDHIAAQRAPAGLRWEVIVVDNASADGTAEVALSRWPSNSPVEARVVREERLGLTHARVRGFAEARGALVSWVEDDNLIAPDWLAGVVEVMGAHPEAGACAGFNELAPASERPPWWLERLGWAFACGAQGSEGDITEDRGFLWGAGLTVRAEAWRHLVEHGWRPLLSDRRGGAGYASGGDTELCLALRLSGWRLRYEPRLRLRHALQDHRLNWRYVRRLLRGSGASTPAFDPYRRALGLPTPSGWAPEVRSLARILVRSAPAALREREGDESVLAREQQIGRLRELMRLRGAYDRRLASFQDAPWRREPSRAPT